MATGAKGATPSTTMVSDSKQSSEPKSEEGRCGECKKVIGRTEKAVLCELCELWFHCRCENVADDTYKLMNQDKIHFYCGRCDKAAGSILKTVLGIQRKQENMAVELSRVKDEVTGIANRTVVMQNQLDGVVHHFEREIKEIKEGQSRVSVAVERDVTETEVKKMQSQLDSTVREMKEEMEENLEIERRKMNIIIHGLTDKDGEDDVGEVIKLMEEGLKLDYSRHVEGMVRIGRRISEQKPRPLKIMLTRAESRKEILIRAKDLKGIEMYSRVFITPDLTRKQQEKDRELRWHLKKAKEEGHQNVRIRYGKVVKNEDGRESVLYQPAPKQM
jgi:hypothetical protein